MIRTWGLAVSDTPLDAPSRDGHGVFQFFEHTLVVTVNVCEDVERKTAKSLAELVVRLVYNAFNSYEGSPDTTTLRKVVENTHAKLVRLRGELGLPRAEMAMTLVTFGPEAMSCVIVGGQSMYLVRGDRMQRVSDASRGGELVGGDRPPTYTDISGVPLEPKDVVVLFGEDQLSPAVERHLTRADWSLPQQATRRILTVLEEETGHETMMVSVLMDKSPEFIRPTIPPTIASLLESLRISDPSGPEERETFEDVNPQWGTGTFFEHEQRNYEEIEAEVLGEFVAEEEPEEAPSALAHFLQGARDLLEHFQLRFRSNSDDDEGAPEQSEAEEPGENRVRTYALLGLGLVLIALGLFMAGGPTEQESDNDAQIRARTEEAAQARREAMAGQGAYLKPAQDAGSDAGEESGSGKATLRKILLGAGSVVAVVGAATFWRRRKEEEEGDSRLRASITIRAAEMDSCWGESVNGRVVEVLRSEDHSAGVALVAQDGGNWGLAIARSSGDNSEAAFEAHVVPGKRLLEARVRSSYISRHSGKGGAKGVMLAEVALDVRTSLPEVPFVSIPLLGPDSDVSAEESRAALALAYRWQGVTLALRARGVRLSEAQRHDRLKGARERGLLEQEEYERLCAAIEGRRSRVLEF